MSTHPVQESAAVAPCTSGGNAHQPSSHGFRGKRLTEGDWADIELELHDLSGEVQS